MRIKHQVALGAAVRLLRAGPDLGATYGATLHSPRPISSSVPGTACPGPGRQDQDAIIWAAAWLSFLVDYAFLLVTKDEGAGLAMAPDCQPCKLKTQSEKVAVSLSFSIALLCQAQQSRLAHTESWQTRRPASVYRARCSCQAEQRAFSLCRDLTFARASSATSPLPPPPSPIRKLAKRQGAHRHSCLLRERHLRKASVARWSRPA